VTDHSIPHEHGDCAHQGSSCAQLREEAAVALLVREAPGPQVLAHLESCPPCRDEYLELAALPALLDAAGDTATGTPVPPALPSTALLNRLLSQVARRRRRRNMVTAMATAAAVLAIAVPAARLIDQDGPARTSQPSAASTPTGPYGPRSPGSSASFAGSGSNPAVGARIDVSIDASGRGSAVSVSVHGVPDGGHCRLVVHQVTGQALPAGSWVIEQGYRDEPYVEQVAIAPASITQVELLDEGTGRRIVEASIHQV
jgi:hypothetical protein